MTVPRVPFVSVLIVRISPIPHLQSSVRWHLCWLFCVSFILGLASQAAVSLNSEEQTLARYLTTASGQQRDRTQMVADPRLCQVARTRAADMARRKYFSHVNPDGLGPNALVRAAGYPLPSHYNTAASGNNVESISAGFENAGVAWQNWMGSSGHKTHLLATDSFYRDQTTYGVGFYSDPNSPYVRYYVVITAPPAGDTLSITSPTAGSRVLEDQVTVTGKVSASADRLLYRLENANGTSEWQQASLPSGSGIGTWSATVPGLVLGNNTIRAKTLNASGETVKEATRSMRMVILTPLTVEVAGDGKITSGFLGTTERELGAAYTIQATPKAGAIFSHWEGFLDSATRDLRLPKQSFEMTEGLALRAHFIPNPFPAVSGNYSGLIVSENPAFEDSGTLRITVTKNGGFSGQLIRGASRLTVRGTLNSAGFATVALGASGLSLTVQLDLENPTESLSATLSDGTTQWTTVANRRAPVDKSVKRSIRHTFRIAPDVATPTSPQGFGFGTAVITPSNTVAFAGTLPDGRKVAAAGSLAANGSVEIYAPLFGGRGAFIAPLQISGDSLQGTANWFKPERLTDSISPAAFHATNAIHGGLYIPPTQSNSHHAAPQVEQVLTLLGGDLSTAADQKVALDVAGRFSWTEATIPGLKLRMQASTGILSGSFVHPLGGVRVFRGAMIQADGSAWGFFAGPSEVGAVTLQPRVE